jgi:N-acetylglucosamine-6-phosphate deacetylase
MENEKYALFSKRLITPVEFLSDAVILIESGKIIGVESQNGFVLPEMFKKIDLGDKIIAPGFVDIHNHGGMGMMVAAAGKEALKPNADRLVETGCTSWLPTVNNLECLHEIVEFIGEKHEGGTDIPGIHMEGPFLTPKAIKGIRGIDAGLEEPSVERFTQFIQAAQGYLLMMGISVELEKSGLIIQEMKKNGVVPAIAHSTRATYEQFMQGVEAGIRHVTHTYNVMTGLHHRNPGVVGGALTCDEVTNEIISDGYHVSPVAIDVLIRCKGTDQVCIITDNTSVAGLADGEYEIGGRQLVKKDGVTRFKDSTADMDHTMAGSEWPINHNVRVMVQKVGIGLPDAVKMASLIPSKVLGLDHRIGSIETGKDADIVVFDDEVNVFMTMVKGKVCFDSKGLNE